MKSKALVGDLRAISPHSLMNKPNEIEHEQQLIKKGREELISKFDTAEARTYYSNTDSGRWTLVECFHLFRDTLIAVTNDWQRKSVGSEKVIWQMCTVMKEQVIDYLGADVVTVYALKGIIDAYCRSKESALAIEVAHSIGRRIEAEVQMKWIQNNTNEEIASSARRNASLPGSHPKIRMKRTKHQATKKTKKLLGKSIEGEWSRPLNKVLVFT